MSLLAIMLLCQAVLGNYTYAPIQKPLDGTHSLACVGISYNNPGNDYVTAWRCKAGAEKVANFYLSNSRGQFKFKSAGYHMDVEAPTSQYAVAERLAKKTFKAEFYIIPSVFRGGGNHASNDIAHVTQFTSWVWSHEVGHLLGLQHTGAFVISDHGDVKYNHYADRDSVMGGGGTGSKYLTAPQYYQKGWLPEDEAALYVNGTSTVFELKQITNFKGNGLSTVVIPNSLLLKTMSHSELIDGRPAYVAFPKSCGKVKCFALYLANKGGSAKIGSSKTEIFDNYFTGLHIKVVGQTANTLMVTIDFKPAPAGSSFMENNNKGSGQVIKNVDELNEAEYEGNDDDNILTL